MGKRQTRIVQFHHKGPEHLVNFDGASFAKKDRRNILRQAQMPWNDGQHHRKFLRSRGICIDENGREIADELMWWGEWEGVSNVREIDYPSSPTLGFYPTYIHQPVPKRLEDYLKDPIVQPNSEDVNWQNTDPFVFGPQFLYSNCQQSKGDNGIMKSLDKGSVIVMGSRVGGIFRVDTVFVVAEILCSYGKSNLDELWSLVEKGQITRTFWHTTIVPLLKLHRRGRTTSCTGRETEPDMSYNLYLGATYDNPFNGMYSFFPCMRYKDGAGFARPTVNHDRFINPNLFMKIQSNDSDKTPWIVSRDEAKAFWTCIRKQVLDKGLLLGVKAEVNELYEAVAN